MVIAPLWGLWLYFPLSQVVYMGICVYTPAFALNAGEKSTHIFLWLGCLRQICDTLFHPSNRIWTVGCSAGHWTSLHFIHDTSEFLKEIIWLCLSVENIYQGLIIVPDISSSMFCVFLTGWVESGHLDRRISDACDVRRAAGCHRGGNSTGWRSLGSLEESLGRKPHRLSRVSLQCSLVAVL